MNSALRIDFCSRKAAEYAVTHWHYSRSMPAGKLVSIGVWEDGRFKGCVIFSRGANNHIGRPYGLTQQEVCELTRVALDKHEAPVTRIISLGLRMLKKHCPGLRLVVSYADSNQGHHGGIYQAGNWVYEGANNTDHGLRVKGRKVHRRTLSSRYGTADLSWIKKNVDPRAEKILGTPKFKYLMPLDRAMRKQVQPLSKPYPKRPTDGGS